MKNKIVFISGIFNILHPGHLRFIKYAKSCGNKLVVGLISNKLITNKESFLSQELRLEALSSINNIDKIILINKSVETTLQKLKPNIVVKGKEYEIPTEMLGFFGMRPVSINPLETLDFSKIPIQKMFAY